MQERYKFREEKLPVYTALVDVLEIKGENVSLIQFERYAFI